MIHAKIYLFIKFDAFIRNPDLTSIIFLVSVTYEILMKINTCAKVICNAVMFLSD